MKHPFPGYGYPAHHVAGSPGLWLGEGDGSFTRGFVTTACLSAFQDVPCPSSSAHLKRVLRHALQGGTAFAAGSRATVALRQGDYSGALLATALGATGVLLIEQLLRDARRLDREKGDGQEK